MADTLVRGFGMHKCDCYGKRGGEWVRDDVVFNLIDSISKISSDALYRQFEAAIWFAGSGPIRVRKCADVAVVVLDADQRHFFLTFIDGASGTAYVFDTLFPRSDAELAKLVASMAPGKRAIVNMTGRIRQSGATCGAWTVWIAAAMALDYAGCRSDVGRVATGADVIGFWRGVTK